MEGGTYLRKARRPHKVVLVEGSVLAKLHAVRFVKLALQLALHGPGLYQVHQRLIGNPPERLLGCRLLGRGRRHDFQHFRPTARCPTACCCCCRPRGGCGGCRGGCRRRIRIPRRRSPRRRSRGGCLCCRRCKLRGEVDLVALDVKMTTKRLQSPQGNDPSPRCSLGCHGAGCRDLGHGRVVYRKGHGRRVRGPRSHDRLEDVGAFRGGRARQVAPRCWVGPARAALPRCRLWCRGG